MCNTIPVQPTVRNVHNIAMLLQDIMDMELRGLLTDCVEHSPLEVNRFSVGQGIPHILWNIKFITAFMSAHSEVCMCKN